MSVFPAVDLTPTEADYDHARQAFLALAKRGLSLAESQVVLESAISAVANDLRSGRVEMVALAAQHEPEDPTRPTNEEVRIIRGLLTRALAVYNGRRGAYTIGSTIGTESGIKSINRAAVARRARCRDEVDAQINFLHISKIPRDGKSRARAPFCQYTVAATLRIGTRARALSAVIIETRRGYRIAAFNPIHC